MNIIKYFRLNGVSTPFFGISWNTDNKQIIGEYCMIRKYMKSYLISYHIDSNKEEGSEYFHGDFLEEYKDKIFQLYDQIENYIYQTKYFVNLKSDIQKLWIQIFDAVRVMKINSEKSIDSEELQEFVKPDPAAAKLNVCEVVKKETAMRQFLIHKQLLMDLHHIY